MIPASDQAARDQIRNSLGVTMLVEAAAGTGKTTELINRIVNVIAEGRARIHEIVAVTFTEKAAGELKLRLRSRLEDQRQRVQGEDQQANLRDATARLEEAHINTIHGFCADLLRERPVEAGVDPRFECLDDVSSRRLYDEAFGLWLEEKLENLPEGMRRALRRPTWDDPTARLRAAGWELVQWQDYKKPWRRDPFAREGEIDSLVAKLHDFAELTKSPLKKNDGLYEDTRKARRLSDDISQTEKVRERDYDGLEADFVSFVSYLDEEGKKFREPRIGFGSDYAKGLPRERILATHGEFAAAAQRFAKLADADLAALLHAELRESIDRYNQLKARSGRLDFLDLLLRTRDMVRDCPPVREEFQQRFKCIFIDEFQDTDPLQVEILLLLSASDPSVSEWREVTPGAGRLFAVGDPKQGVYRFRRADLGIYREVKDLLARQGAMCVYLTTSFRSVPSIQNAVNAAFAPVMTGDSKTLQADYVPLSPCRQENLDQPTVVVLPVPDPYGTSGKPTQTAIEKSLPDATAAFVQWLIQESGWTVTESERSGERVPVEARHVCLLFRRFESWGKDVTGGYIAALEAREIPHLLVGGKSFHKREEVQTLRAALAAIEWPDDELSVFATLKGSLFAIPDDALLEYRRLYRQLHPFRIPTEKLAPGLAAIAETLLVLQSLHRNRNHRPAAETVGRLLETTRAHAGFVLRPSGRQALANVLHVAELARHYEEQGGISFRGFVELLRQEAEGGQTSEAPILEEESDGVRIMTVHKAKGLEFPVVILADITAKLSRPSPSRHLDSTSGLSAVQIGGWTPVELLERSDDEAARDRAEGVRVAYVAATRARDLLVIPAVGDQGPDAWQKSISNWWVSPLNAAIYPQVDRRRSPSVAMACPQFGDDSVRKRVRAKQGGDNVAPGRYEFGTSRGGKKDGEYHVVWWDPKRLLLDVEPTYGVHHKDLLKEIDPEIVAADRRNYEAWREDRRVALDHGSRASLTVETATEWASSTTERLPVQVMILEAGPEIDRPAGPRYGALIHSVLARIQLDAGRETVLAAAALEGRILGATPEEVASACDTVVAALRHPLMQRAREAAAIGCCRRETPVTLSFGENTLVEGIADIAFSHEDRWTVIDFKTDRELEKRLDIYRRQVSLYAEAISLATGQRCDAVLMRI
ncbi:MAG TPA: UvrD-helicase domain-containing protein [Terriglobia bacterium]|nr:UvrD-helicase domain-containing protein [Terriglobia bacterium]